MIRRLKLSLKSEEKNDYRNMKHDTCIFDGIPQDDLLVSKSVLPGHFTVAIARLERPGLSYSHVR